jgi:hypothetical protein
MRAESDIKSITYTYSGANISTLTYYDKLAKSVSFADTIDYDANNRMTRLRATYYPGRFSAVNNQYTYLFSYKGNNIDKISSIHQGESNSSSGDSLTNIFNVDAAGNTQSSNRPIKGTRPHWAVSITPVLWFQVARRCAAIHSLCRPFAAQERSAPVSTL